MLYYYVVVLYVNQINIFKGKINILHYFRFY